MIATAKKEAAPYASVPADAGPTPTLNRGIVPQNSDFVADNNKAMPAATCLCDEDISILEHVLPADLRQNGRFCLWRYEERNGKKTKVPYSGFSGSPAKSNDPDTFCRLDSCFFAVTDRNYDGVGLGIFDGFCAIDMDKCVKEDGSLSTMEQDIIETMHAYSEYSPSRSGIHILFKAEGFSYDTKRYYIMNHKAGLEVYVSGATNKYVTVTGTYVGSDLSLDQSFGDRSDELRRVLEKYMVRPEAIEEQNPIDNFCAVNALNAVNSILPDDEQLLNLAMGSKTGDAFRRLWTGDTTGYSSHSEADMALCSRLAFWTQKDAVRMDALFRRSGLMRDKWDEKRNGSTYGQMTIEKASAACHEMYTPLSKAPLPFSQKQPNAENAKAAIVPMFRPFSPIKSATSCLPPFPLDALPAVIRDYVSAVATNTQTAPDMAGVISLGVLAICLQGKYQVEVNPDWCEQLSLLTTVIALPGERKSPVMKAMTKYINEYEQDYNKSLAPMIRKNKQERESIERRVAGLKKELEHSVNNMTELELQHLQDNLADMEDVHTIRFTADDCTSEALTELMAHNNGRIGVISAEGGIFDILVGRYSNKTNLDIWLKGWCGDTLRVDRLNRESQYLPNPSLSAAFAIQPSVLEEIMDNPVMNGRGLIARFLFSSPPSSIGNRSFFVPAVPQECKEAYKALVYRLMDLPLGETPFKLTLSSSAAHCIERAFQENEQFLLGTGQVISEWANKYIGTIARIAGLIHLAESTTTKISGSVLDRAVQLGKYFQAHTRYAYTLMGTDISQNKATFILAQLREKAVKEIKRQGLFQMCRGRYFKKTEDIVPILDLLEEHGYLVQYQLERSGAGRPPDVRVIVNTQTLST